MSDKQDRNDLSFFGYLGRQAVTAGIVLAGSVAGWYIGRQITRMTNYVGPSLRFMEKQQMHFHLNRMGPLINKDLILPLSALGAVVGGSVGGLYQSFQGWKATKKHRENIAKIADAVDGQDHSALHEQHQSILDALVASEDGIDGALPTSFVKRGSIKSEKLAAQAVQESSKSV